MLMRAAHLGAALKGKLKKLGITHTEFVRKITVPPDRVG